MAETKSSYPVIDMQDVKTLPENISKACETYGFFRLKNHGIPLSLMSEMKEVARFLLDLPMEMKHRNLNHDEPFKGYTAPNMAGPFFDSLSLYDMASSKAVDEFCEQMDASTYQREVIHKYTSALNHLVKFLGSKLMEGLGLSGELFPEVINQLKLNRYDYSQETMGYTGAVMHSDVGIFTILHDDENVNGLEAVDDNTGELVPVDHVPGTLVIIVGDVGKVWSNGRFCSVKHRVQCYEAKTRITMALFVLPLEDVKVKVLPQLIDSEHHALYVPFDFDQYRKLRTSTKSPTGEALEFFKVKPEVNGH